ncbi:PREDICTED: aldehyde dehydrogenase family 3 member F1-like [Lupinus angustifolius]|uniref:aldehyde dehydrogenase family 3 member F1-like n=1 Tax=Lupinus angustifolius TaxID=3871 RepID=UPI00092F7CB6|nr:PREDICTED: aldehyde dehydrogenase family 3 member F1-like [Lupinus angustifolius]
MNNSYVSKQSSIFFGLSAKKSRRKPTRSVFAEEVVVKRILVAKYGACAGQACITIDYILVEKSFSSELVALMKIWIKEMFGDNPKASNTIARIVNEKHFSRLKSLLTDPINHIIYNEIYRTTYCTSEVYWITLSSYQM